MSRYGKAETLAIAAAVLFSVLFFVLFFAFVPISAGLKQRRTPSSSATAADHTHARPAESHKRHTTANRSRRNHEHRIRGMRPLNHLTWSITDYRVRISSNLEKGAHVEQSDK